MYTITIDKTFEFFMKIYYTTGIWPRKDESLLRQSAKRLFYASFGVFFPIIFVLNSIFCEDPDESLFSVQMAIIVSIFYLRFLYALFTKSSILEFLAQLDHYIESRKEYEQINQKTNKFITFVRSYVAMLWLTAFVLIISRLPLFSSDRGLPYFISFSWNDSEIIYWLAFLFMTLEICVFSISATFTPFCWYLLLNFSIKYDMLGNSLKRLGRGGVKMVNTVYSKKKNNQFIEEITVQIKNHVDLFNTLERFKECFQTFFASQIITSGPIICASVYNLAFASSENVFLAEIYLSILFYGIFDIFLVMYLGNEIILTSEPLPYCLFQSNWMDQSESAKKYVIIMAELLKQPYTLSVVIYQLNLETFTSIINTAYSMFNLLKSVQEE
ncbi:odorant receptor 94b-like [Bradysia coprophila]|uniref:odorant receptor 94b-like n=1 Tax=Bradysia coprophila TaxID=38358 RepID=UPI00187D9E2E|nr:odorant receptor 94b-like [Bradysia coprophila]